MSVSIFSAFYRTLCVHRKLAVIATAVAGLALGLWLYALSHSVRSPPTLGQLIRDLGKRDTPFHNAWQDLWTLLPSAVTSWMPSLKPRPAVEVRRAAAQGLGDFGAGAVRAIPALLRALEDPDPEVAAGALQALQNLGSAADVAGDAIFEFFNDPAHDSGVGFPLLRAHAAGAMAAIRPHDERVVAALLDVALRHRTPELRVSMIASLSTIRPAPATLVPALITLLRYPDGTVQLAAISALGSLGPEAKAAVPELMALFGEEAKAAAQPQPNPAALQARVWGQSNSPPVPPPGIRRPPPLPAAPALPVGKGQFKSAVRAGTAVASVTALYQALPRFPRPNVGFLRGPIIDTLGKIGPDAKAALPLLEDAAGPKWSYQSAVFAKWQIDGNTPAAVRSFSTLLESDSSIQTRSQALGYLARLGPEAAPVLCRALDDPQLSIRVGAADALGNLGAAAKSALPKLQTLRQTDPKFAVRRAAEVAVRKIQP
jgi:HEAT repeat protein